MAQTIAAVAIVAGETTHIPSFTCLHLRHMSRPFSFPSPTSQNQQPKPHTRSSRTPSPFAPSSATHHHHFSPP
uniref:Putative ovule protein n=1 Tax=Solanum chacoense TaxID=4108 RepID=A0A0V0GMJ5_SOLCH